MVCEDSRRGGGLRRYPCGDLGGVGTQPCQQVGLLWGVVRIWVLWSKWQPVGPGFRDTLISPPSMTVLAGVVYLSKCVS